MFSPIMFIIAILLTAIYLPVLMLNNAFHIDEDITANTYKILAVLGSYWIVLIATTIIDVIVENKKKG